MHILIIEDEPDIRQELKQLLEHALYQVTAVTELTNLTEKIQSIRPDLVLLDVNLPGESGFDVCQKLRAVPDVPVIFVTSRTDSMDELNGMLRGGDRDYSGISGESEYVGVQGSQTGRNMLLAFCHDKQAVKPGGTFNILSTIDTVTAGHIYYGDTDITELSQDQLSEFRKENLGFVFQEYNLLDTLTMEENIMHGVQA